MTLNDIKHLELLKRSCEVFIETENPKAVWFDDCGFKAAEIYSEDEGGWISYSCPTKEMFEKLCEEFRM